jgi:hypothetical protein
MAKYELTESGCRDKERGYHIPDDPNNRHWKEFQEWLAEGNTPDPEPVPVPPTAEEALNLQLLQTDKEMLRGFDWLLQTLVQKGIIDLAEIPQALKDLYLARNALRGQ